MRRAFEMGVYRGRGRVPGQTIYRDLQTGAAPRLWLALLVAPAGCKPGCWWWDRMVILLGPSIDLPATFQRSSIARISVPVGPAGRGRQFPVRCSPSIMSIARGVYQRMHFVYQN